MKKKLINYIIVALSTTLILTTTYCYYIYKSQTNKKDKILKQDIGLTTSKTTIDSMQDKVEDLKIQIQQTNKLVTCKGLAKVKLTFSDKSISEDDTKMSWLKDKLASLSSKEISIDATYKFTYTYDLSTLPIDMVRDSIHIKLSRNNLELENVELDTNNIHISETTGLFAKDITKTEYNALLNRVGELVKNNLMNNKEVRDKSIKYTEDNIRSLCNSLGVDNVNIETNKYDVVEHEIEEIETVYITTMQD